MPKQLMFEKVGGWGGKRRGAGRPNRSYMVNHMKRPKMTSQHPGHVTMRLLKGVPNLRTRRNLEEFKRAATQAQEFGLRVIHFSLESNHIHMVIEADNNKRLAAGMRSLGCRFAKIIRKYMAETMGKPETGPVFAGRYHLRLLTTPTETKNAMEYVLLNHAKHMKVIEHVDPFSSGHHFKGWKALLGKRYRFTIRDQLDERDRLKAYSILDEALSPPESWLARTGWLRAC